MCLLQIPGRLEGGGEGGGETMHGEGRGCKSRNKVEEDKRAHRPFGDGDVIGPQMKLHHERFQ